MSNTLDTHLVAYQGGNLYDFDNEILLTWYPQRVLQLAGSTGALLELGLGHGFTTKIFANHFEQHVVIEGSPAVIRNFKEKNPECGAQIVQTFFEEFSTEKKYDVIVMGFILEHVDDPMLVLRHFRQFLVPGGKMFLAVPNAEVMNRRLGHLSGMLVDMSALSENDYQLGHKRYYTVASLTSEVAQAGYRIERLEGIYLKPFTTKQIVSLQLDSKIIIALCDLGQHYPELSCGILAEISAT
jgi:2-polyprenyl-3-methyl-5-hydroxy-6-metoxy-1,4-benzoquinol methylase